MGRARRPAVGLLNALTFPFLRPIRQVVPPIGGTLDLSPLVVIVIAQLLLMMLLEHSVAGGWHRMTRRARVRVRSAQ